MERRRDRRCHRTAGRHGHHGARRAQEARETTVGMAGEIRELVLPGPELEAVPATAEQPIVLRIVSVSPHGTAFRYDLAYWGLEPGAHDLTEYLRPKAGSAASPEDLPEVIVHVRSILPDGRVQPNTPAASALPRLGGYRTTMIVAGILWTIGLLALLFVGRRHKKRDAAERRPLTLADRLRPLIERATTGDLSRAERAELELSLLAYWRRRLNLEDLRPTDAMATLREHREAGPLLVKLEQWLHVPTPVDDVDLPRLLEPYRNLPAEAIDLPTAGPGQSTAIHADA